MKQTKPIGLRIFISTTDNRKSFLAELRIFYSDIINKYIINKVDDKSCSPYQR